MVLSKIHNLFFLVFHLKAYAWVKCERLEDANCYEIFSAAKIKGREGKVFGSEERLVRLSLIRTQDDFDQLIDMLKKLVSQEVVRPDSIQKLNVDISSLQFNHIK